MDLSKPLDDAIDWTQELVFTGKGKGFQVTVLGRLRINEEGIAHPDTFEEAAPMIVNKDTRTTFSRGFFKKTAPKGLNPVRYLNGEWMYIVNKPDESGWNGVKKHYFENGYDIHAEAPPIVERYGNSKLQGVQVTNVWLDELAAAEDFDAVINAQVKLEIEEQLRRNIPNWGGF